MFHLDMENIGGGGVGGSGRIGGWGSNQCIILTTEIAVSIFSIITIYVQPVNHNYTSIAVGSHSIHKQAWMKTMVR